MENAEVHPLRPWLKFYDPNVPAHLDYPAVRLDRLLTDAAEKHPDRAALIFGARVGDRLMDRAVSYRRLEHAVNRFASGIQSLGVKKGDRVAIYLPNCPQFVIAFFGTLRAGGIVAPCNPLYAPPELEHQINDAGAEVLVTLSSAYKVVDRFRSATPLRHVIAANIKEWFPPLLRLLFTLAEEKKGGYRAEVDPARDFWFPQLLRAAALPPNPVEIGPEDGACLLYTGGTTGTPKGAELLHRNLVANAVMCNAWADARGEGECTVGALPLFHSYGMTTVMNTGVVNAGTMVLIADPRDILHVMGSISKHQATFFPGVPTMYVAVNNHPRAKDFDLRSILACQSGAAPLPREVQEKFQALTGARLMEGFGLSEASPVTHGNPRYGENRIGTIGLPFPDTDARIVDVETGESELPAGEIGELVIRGPQVMKGYWQQPTETANVLREHAALGPGLWLHTGDIAAVDEDGYFRIVDRKKDMIICGGFNVYPRDVEEALYRHPAVKEAAVLGIPDEYRGESVKAFVVLKEGQEASAEELIAFCRENLAKYKVPRVIEFRKELPKSAVGKVLRRELAKG